MGTGTSSALTALLCIPLSAQDQAAEARPVTHWPGESWATVSPAEAGLDAAQLNAITGYVLSQRSTSFLIVRGGRIVLERYGEGGGREVRRGIASATKSMTAILVGMAIDAEHLTGVDQPVADFLPAWKDTPKAAITIRHLLSMSSGLDPRGFARTRPEGDQFEHNGTMRLAAKPGTVWNYNTPAYHMLFRLLEKATGKSLPEWSRSMLLGPLGMRHSEWNSQVRGEVTNYFNLSCTARDMARFGLFVLRGGRWKDRQLVSPEFFAAATRPSQDMNPAYGYLFWLNRQKGHRAGGRRIDYRFPGAPRDLIACLGARGQQIIALPSQDLVIVRQGEAAADRQLAQRYVRMVLGSITGGGFPTEPIPKAGSRLPAAFARLDTDGDGRISRAEFAASGIAKRRPRWFARADTDGDGFVSEAEARKQAEQRRRRPPG